jgi:inner membrane transporter RhtA
VSSLSSPSASSSAVHVSSASSARPALAVVGAVASVQIGAAVAKSLFDVAGATGTVAVRLATAALVLVLVTRPRVRGVPARHLALAAGFGVLLGALNLTFYASIQRIPLGVAVTLEFAGPLAVAVLGSRRPRDLAWIALAGVGVVLLTGGRRSLLDGSLDPVGVALALLAGAGWGGYIVVNQRVGAVLPGMDGLAIALVVAALLVAPIGVGTAGEALLRPQVLAVGAAVGLLSSAIPWVLETVALRSMPTSTFGVLMSLEPAGAALAGLALLGERLTAVQALAILLACVASAGAAASARPRSHPTACTSPVPAAGAAQASGPVPIGCVECR